MFKNLELIRVHFNVLIYTSIMHADYHKIIVYSWSLEPRYELTEWVHLDLLTIK